MKVAGAFVLSMMALFFGCIGWEHLMAGTFAGWEPAFQTLTILCVVMIPAALVVLPSGRSVVPEEEPAQPRETPLGEPVISAKDREQSIPVYRG